MKFLAWASRVFDIPPSVQQDAGFLPVLYAFNFYWFSAWGHLAQVTTKPWLLLIWLYGLVTLVPLVWRDRAPRTVFAVQCGFTMAAWPIMPLYAPVVGILVALYPISVCYDRRVSLLALLISFVPSGLVAVSYFEIHHTSYVRIQAFIGTGVSLVLMAFGVWYLGRITQARKRRVQALESEKRTAQEAAAEERRRIAAELHDIVCHAVTLMVLQAAGAARVAKTDFTDVTQALQNIESKGTQAMVELQRLLWVLRSDAPTDHATATDKLRPQPGLADLPGLLDSLPAIGIQLTYRVEGTPRDLDPSVDLAAYRIVQEGLTNVLRHAGERANPQLLLVWQDHALLIQIDNGTNLTEVNHKRATSGGRGLVGLHERVQAVGGLLDAGPHPGAGYRLTATLPIATHPRVSSATVPPASGQDHGN